AGLRGGLGAVAVEDVLQARGEWGVPGAGGAGDPAVVRPAGGGGARCARGVGGGGGARGVGLRGHTPPLRSVDGCVYRLARSARASAAGETCEAPDHLVLRDTDLSGWREWQRGRLSPARRALHGRC